MRQLNKIERMFLEAIREYYDIVRFMASEVYVNARKCIEDLDEIMSEYHSQGLSLLAK